MGEFLLTASLFLQTHVSFAQDQLTLLERWELEKESFLEGMSSETLHRLRKKHVLFVPGFLNGFARVPRVASYYRDSIDAVENEIGAEASYFAPPSWRGIPENSETLYREVLRRHYEVGKPLILIGHSKGAAEILHMLLNHPELVLNRTPWGPIVDRAALIQGAIGGSPLAYQSEYGLKMGFLHWFLGPGMDSLDPDHAVEIFSQAFANFQNQLKRIYGNLGEDAVYKRGNEVSDRVFYIRGVQEQEALSSVVKMVIFYCGKTLESRQSDGLLTIEDQKLDLSKLNLNTLDNLYWDQFGVDLGVVPMDHIETTVSGFVTRSSSLERRAFIRAVLQQISQ